MVVSWGGSASVNFTAAPESASIVVVNSTAVVSTPLGSVSFSDVFNSLKLTSPAGVFAAFSSSSSTIFVWLSGLCALQAVAPSSSSSYSPSATPEIAISSFSFGLLIPLEPLIRLMSIVELSVVKIDSTS